MEKLLGECDGRLVDQEFVAEYLGISTKTLEYYRWKKMGPRYLKIGSLVRYRKCDIVAYVVRLMEELENKND